MYMYQKGKKRIKTSAIINEDLFNYFKENRQQGLYPQSLTQWIDEKMNENILFIANKTMNNKIAKLDNRTQNILFRLDIIEKNVINIKKKFYKSNDYTT